MVVLAATRNPQPTTLARRRVSPPAQTHRRSRNAGPSERGAQQVQVLVKSVALDGRDDVVVEEVLLQVSNVDTGGANLGRGNANGGSAPRET